jgi:hypothetical protein
LNNQPDIVFLNVLPDQVAERKVLIEKFPIGLKHVLKIKNYYVSRQKYQQAAVVRDYQVTFYGRD